VSPSDKLTIDTPEQIPLEFPLAGIGSRFLAVALDTLIQVFGYLVLVLVFSWFAPDLAKIWPKGTTWAMAILIILGFVIYSGYFALFETVWNGQTPGKRAVRIRVIKDSGRPISVYEAVARNVIRIVDQFPGIYAVGIISVFISSRNKRLGDFVAGTVVVHETALTELQPAWQADKAGIASAYNVGQLSLGDLELMEAFLQRRYDLALDVRQRTAEQISTRMRQKLQVTQDRASSDEDFLEKLARERRDIAGFSSQ
jgi:uncharacterized RDD family membrane protein YckC